ncbi:MAG: lipid-A-disaccharide synthase [Clostridium sp.]|nr:lipid-A-disaccharide synthase [Clostridium sp.]
MKYYLIAGEASGDLHASHLMRALRGRDSRAEFRFFGGDLMKREGGTCVRHYREMAYMGFIPVLMHLPAILSNMKRCREDVLAWRPDVLILIDYPGFNLSIAEYIHTHSCIPVYYYISPKIWAWKEYRINSIRKYVDEMFSILPFEIDFYEKKHRYPIHYVGNPTVDEVARFRREYAETPDEFRKRHSLDGRPVIALLAGSRRQEIKDNLLRMVEAAASYAGEYQLVLAGAPNIEPEYYNSLLAGRAVKVVYGRTYALLSHSVAALVTSGTATLETALFRVPQVVCYYVACGRLVSWLRRRLLKVRFISLVNLIADREVVPELVADGMTADNVRTRLRRILPDGEDRNAMLRGYEDMAARLGREGAPERAACLMTDLLAGKTV